MISIDKSALLEYTLLPNSFIDYYLLDTDGDHLKVYIYLLRNSETDKASLDIPSICEGLNLSERKIKNALKHWEEEGLLELFYNGESLSGIRFLSPSKAAAAKEKHRLTNERVRKLVNEDAEAKQLIFLAENYFAKPLSKTDVGTLLYLHDKLGFSVDLCDYLLDYTVSHNANSMRYAEKVALAWYEKGIKTVEAAKADSKISSDVPLTNTPAPDGENRPKNASKNQFLNFDQHNYDMKELERKAKAKSKGNINGTD